MSLDLTDCQFQGPAFPEPFVKFELEKELARLKLLPKSTGAEGRTLAEQWEVYRRKLRALSASGGEMRVFNHVLEPLQELLGYTGDVENAPLVQTREDREEGGRLLASADGSAKLRVWTTPFDEDLYAPAKRGRAYRFSHLRIAQRVLLATGERMGLLTNGVQLMLLISDPARPDSTVTIPLDPGWKLSRDVRDSFRFLLAVAQPAGVKALPELVDKARLQQARVTKDLRKQAREAVENFVQEVFEHPTNRAWLETQTNRSALAKQLWREGLITVYRLLFVLKLESSDDPARSFSFASTSLWRHTYSPGIALAPFADDVLNKGLETGELLEQGLRSLFRMFEEGLDCTELVVKPLGGALFGKNATPILSQLAWGERAVAWLLDRLLWTPKRKGSDARERVHYGSLDVEDLGRVYEALLELEPGITTEPMCRLRRQKLEVVVPLAQGEKYRPVVPVELAADDVEDTVDESEDTAPQDNESEEETTGRSKKTKVEWIEAIPPHRFYLRVGLGRKASGSYYTPHSFVRFLVQETLGPQVAERSPAENPQPLKILELKVLDPAMGSGHFLVEACRFLGDKLYEACRLCDERALTADRKAEAANNETDREAAKEQARELRQRVIDLPDPDDELLRYLPSRSPEGEETGFSQRRAVALCRRLVATHCLYGVDKNPLAVELAKLALWLESHAEGMPLTFLDHRFVLGDSLTGPFWEKLLFRPSKPEEKIESRMFFTSLENNLRAALFDSLKQVKRLEASVGATVSEMREKEQAKHDLDEALLPFRIAAAAWSGGVMLGPEQCDDTAYAELLQTIASTRELPAEIESEPLRAMIARGLGVEEVPANSRELIALVESGRYDPSLSYDLTFPEVFYPKGVVYERQGFHAVLGNPPWDKLRIERRDLLASVDTDYLLGKESAGVGDEHNLIEKAFLLHREARDAERTVMGTKRCFPLLHKEHANCSGLIASSGDPDQYRMFSVLALQLLKVNGTLGFIVGGGLAKNPADAPLRRLLFQVSEVKVFAHYLNLKQLFEGASSRVSFVIIVAEKGNGLCDTSIGFDLTQFQQLSRDIQGDLEFKSFPLCSVREHLDKNDDLTQFVDNRKQFLRSIGSVVEGLTGLNIRMSNDLHRTGCKPVLELLKHVVPGALDARLPDVLNKIIATGYACFYDGRSIDLFNAIPTRKSGKWLPQVLLVANMSHSMMNRLVHRMRYFRFAWRSTCGHPKTNMRSARSCILPAGCTAGNSILIETDPASRSTVAALLATGVLNSFALDYQVRPAIQSHLNLSVIANGGWPKIAAIPKLFIAHSATRLSCVSMSYAPLWQEQFGETWREPNKEPFTWPVLAEDDERWVVRAAIDAVVAEAYGLSREQYAHVLSTFSHASYRRAPELCLAMFDELKLLGLDAFTKKHDPYWDIPLNENLPQPVIELPIPNTTPPPSESDTPEIDPNADFQLARGPAPVKKKAARKKSVRRNQG